MSTTYFDRFGVSTEVLGRILSRALSRGGDYAEIYLQHRITHGIALEDGEVNRASTGVDLGAGVRVLAGDATGYAYSEDLDEKALERAADVAATIASGPAAVAMALRATAVESQYKTRVSWPDVPVKDKMPFLLRADAVARGRDTSIVKVTVNVSDDSSHLLIATSEGLLVEDDRPMALLAVSCVAEKNGATETGYANAAAREDVGFFSDARIARIASRAADDTMILFDAVPAPVGEVPVVLAPGISAILLHEAMGHGMEADFARKGTTIYSDRIGQRIAPADVTIIDDAGGNIRGSINIDDEGTPGQRTVLVENGILRSFLHDRISARHFGVASTGSGRRESFRSPPLPRMRNTVMLEGPHDPGEIIASVPRGLYAEVFSNGQVNIGAGDFTFYLKHGRLIENGKLGPVVKDANLIGSGPKVLESVVMVGRDVKVESSAGTCGKDGQSVPVGFGMPTTKVGAISVGGRAS